MRILKPKDTCGNPYRAAYNALFAARCHRAVDLKLVSEVERLGGGHQLAQRYSREAERSLKAAESMKSSGDVTMCIGTDRYFPAARLLVLHSIRSNVTLA